MTDKQVYTVDEAAELLGMNAQTVRRWCRDGELKAARMGRHYRISRRALAEFWMARGGGRLFDNGAGDWTVGWQPTDDYDRRNLANIALESLRDTSQSVNLEEYHNPLKGRDENRWHGWTHGNYGPATIPVGTVIIDADTDELLAVHGSEWWIAPLIEECGGGNDR